MDTARLQRIAVFAALTIGLHALAFWLLARTAPEPPAPRGEPVSFDLSTWAQSLPTLESRPEAQRPSAPQPAASSVPKPSSDRPAPARQAGPSPVVGAPVGTAAAPSKDAGRAPDARPNTGAPQGVDASALLARRMLLRTQVLAGPADAPQPVAEGTQTFTHDGKAWQIESESNAPDGGRRNRFAETSEGRFGERGLVPERYGEKRGTRGERATHFQWQKAVLSFSARTDQLPLPEGVQDRLCVRWQIGLIMQTRPELQREGAQFTVPVASTTELMDWRFTVMGREQITVGSQSVIAWRLQRAADAERVFDQQVSVWLAPSLGWAPVKLRLLGTQGRVVEVVATEVALDQ
ncbi:DUF3108 domain-containing protein [Piscinibacterium candidicorallinum]|uniref:DUF3108 domain-containing protein n=1 Tax=Piscinibacterium candidicorallinum TaxID=1793872 RepID=A0ABV7H3B8_9BURK